MVEWRGLAGAVWWERIAGFCQSFHLKSSMSWLPPIWWCWWSTPRLPSLPTLSLLCAQKQLSPFAVVVSQLYNIQWAGCWPYVQTLLPNLKQKPSELTFWYIRYSKLYTIKVLTYCIIHNFSVVQLSTTTTYRLLSQYTLKTSRLYTIWISLPLNLQNVKLNRKLLPVHSQSF